MFHVGIEDLIALAIVASIAIFIGLLCRWFG